MEIERILQYQVNQINGSEDGYIHRGEMTNEPTKPSVFEEDQVEEPLHYTRPQRPQSSILRQPPSAISRHTVLPFAIQNGDNPRLLLPQINHHI